jgi:hypothetical protein
MNGFHGAFVLALPVIEDTGVLGVVYTPRNIM